MFGVALGVGIALGVGDGSTLGRSGTTGVGFFIATPLSQINFLPDLMQVNFFPPTIEVDPTFEHVVPVLTAAIATVPVNKDATTANTRAIRFICRVWHDRCDLVFRRPVRVKKRGDFYRKSLYPSPMSAQKITIEIEIPEVPFTVTSKKRAAKKIAKKAAPVKKKSAAKKPIKKKVAVKKTAKKKPRK